jgi:hypothetical protein
LIGGEHSDRLEFVMWYEDSDHPVTVQPDVMRLARLDNDRDVTQNELATVDLYGLFSQILDSHWCLASISRYQYGSIQGSVSVQ